MKKAITTQLARSIARKVIADKKTVAVSYGLRGTEHMVEQELSKHGYSVGLSFVDADDERTIANLSQWILRNAKSVA